VITERVKRVSGRVETLAHLVADAAQEVSQPVTRLSKAIGVLKGALVGVAAGATLLQGLRDVFGNPHEEPTPDRARVDERSAP
jgi:hypothetical protein